MALPPVRDPIEIYMGDTYPHRLAFVDDEEAAVDVSASTFAAQIRLFGPSLGDPALTFTVDASDAADGIVMLTLSAAQTAQLTPGTTYSMDVQRTTAGVVQTVFTANVTATRDATR